MEVVLVTKIKTDADGSTIVYRVFRFDESNKLVSIGPEQFEKME